MNPLVTDLRVAVRRLLANPSFLASTGLTLALCIGANVAIFSVIDSVLLEPLPFDESERIVTTWNAYPGATGDSGEGGGSNSVPDFYDRRALTDVFEEVALYRNTGRSLELDGIPQQVRSTEVTPSFFPLLRSKARLGRTFTEEEGEVGKNGVVVLSGGLFQQLYGGDESALGRTLLLEGEPHTVIGVMPDDFVFLADETRLWIPTAFTPEERLQYHSNSWQLIARLAPEATLDGARAAIDAINEQQIERIPQLRQILIDAGFHTKVVFLEAHLVRDVSRILYLLWGGVGFVLLIGCVNVANLMLVRSSARSRELATRIALGAPRRRLSSLLLIEGLLLSGLSGVAGLLLGIAGLRALEGLGLERLPRAHQIQIDGTTIVFALLLTVIVGALVTMAPIVGAWRANLSQVFRGGGRGGTSSTRARLLRKGLVVVQVALSLVLLIGAGLLAASFVRLLAVDPGYDLDNVLTASAFLGESRYPETDDLRLAADRFLDRLRQLPGVEEVGLTTQIPLGNNNSDSVILAEGYERPLGESLISPSQSTVAPGYFAAMGMTVLEGRAFDSRDQPDSQKTIIIDERLAKRFYPDGNVLGKRMWRPDSAEALLDSSNATFLTIVGIVNSVSMRGLVEESDRAVGAYYMPLSQQPPRFFTFAIRTTLPANGLIDPVRAAVAEVDPELPLFSVETQKERLELSLSDRKTPMVLVWIFATTALLLAAVGLYGVLAYQVELRTREIGIRAALGSSVGRTFRMVLGEGVVILVVGLFLGLLASSALGKLLVSQLYEVSPTDSTVLLSVVLVLGLVGVLASLVPARRATRVAPVIALLEE